MSARRVGSGISSWLAPASLALLGLCALLSILVAGPLPVEIDLMQSLDPPAFLEGGSWAHPLGTDAQGQDLLGAVIEGARLSLAVAMIGVLSAFGLGFAVGLVAGERGGWIDAVTMRVADLQLSFPALLVALLADGVMRLYGGGGGAAAPAARALAILGAAIALGRWAPIARLARAATWREARRDYVAAARLSGASTLRVLALHVAPNIIGSVLALAALDVGYALIDEATLSYLGLGLPADRPSLGTLIRTGQEVMLSGSWWAVAVPGVVVLALVLWAVSGADAVHARIGRQTP